MPDAHRVELHEIDGVVVASVHGEVQRSSSPALHDVLRTVAGRPLVLDLREVTYFDSSGVGVLQALREAGPLVLVLRPHDIIHRTLAILGLEPLVPSYATIDEAVDSARRSPIHPIAGP